MISQEHVSKTLNNIYSKFGWSYNLNKFTYTEFDCPRPRVYIDFSIEWSNCSLLVREFEKEFLVRNVEFWPRFGLICLRMN